MGLVRAMAAAVPYATQGTHRCSLYRFEITVAIAIAEAVWQVTLVDATLVRHHPDTYDRILAGQDPAQRRLTEQTLAGLRFVRNQIGPEASLAGFIQPGGPGAHHGRVASWTWKPVPDPALPSLTPRGRAWELARYRAYQAHLAGQPTGTTFGRTAAFLNLAAADALSITDGGACRTVTALSRRARSRHGSRPGNPAR